ncbi:MAG: hypothetical protein N2422_03965 [Rhodobacteraceae bacterium]|nr:hypothetical protein [Paracoccaceae bacterium]
MRRATPAQGLARRGETLAALLGVAGGLWIFLLGGWLFWPLGALVMAVAGAWAVLAWRRARFVRPAEAPGVVEVDEGQIGYYAHDFGGFVALAELSEIRVVEAAGHRAWRLRTAGGEMLTIPLSAAGAERLFEAFSSLPGLDTGALVRAMDAPPAAHPLWRRAAPP